MVDRAPVVEEVGSAVDPLVEEASEVADVASAAPVLPAPEATPGAEPRGSGTAGQLMTPEAYAESLAVLRVARGLIQGRPTGITRTRRTSRNRRSYSAIARPDDMPTATSTAVAASPVADPAVPPASSAVEPDQSAGPAGVVATDAPCGEAAPLEAETSVVHGREGAVGSPMSLAGRRETAGEAVIREFLLECGLTADELDGNRDVMKGFIRSIVSSWRRRG